MEQIGLTTEMMLLLAPLIVASYALVIFCIVKIVKEGTANLNKVLWVIIVIAANITGSILFLLIGRKRDGA